MTILITGDSGFLGTRVMRFLGAQGNRSLVLGWSQEKLGDVLNSECQLRAVELSNLEGVLHLAWARTDTADYDSSTAHQLWAESTAHFASLCTEHGLWFGAVGSVVDESISVFTSTPYASAKAYLRKALDKQISTGEIAYIRPHYIFSLEDARPRVLQDYLQASSPETFVPRSPDAMHDFIHVDDVVSALQLIIRQRLTGVIDIRSGTYRTNVSFLSAFGYRSPDSTQAEYLASDSSYLEPLLRLGWKPSVTRSVLESKLG